MKKIRNIQTASGKVKVIAGEYSSRVYDGGILLFEINIGSFDRLHQLISEGWFVDNASIKIFDYAKMLKHFRIIKEVDFSDLPIGTEIAVNPFRCVSGCLHILIKGEKANFRCNNCRIYYEGGDYYSEAPYQDGREDDHSLSKIFTDGKTYSPEVIIVGRGW